MGHKAAQDDNSKKTTPINTLVKSFKSFKAKKTSSTKSPKSDQLSSPTRERHSERIRSSPSKDKDKDKDKESHLTSSTCSMMTPSYKQQIPPNPTIKEELQIPKDDKTESLVNNQLEDIHTDFSNPDNIEIPITGNDTTNPEDINFGILDFNNNMWSGDNEEDLDDIDLDNLDSYTPSKSTPQIPSTSPSNRYQSNISDNQSRTTRSSHQVYSTTEPHTFGQGGRLVQSTRNFPPTTTSPKQIIIPQNLEQTLREANQSLDSDQNERDKQQQSRKGVSAVRTTTGIREKRQLSQFFEDLKVDFDFDSL